MTGQNIVLAPCKHGGGNISSSCKTCQGSGYVRVLVGPDGAPKECKHGGGNISSSCKTCQGSGWAGMVD
jgi:hypothetical protein